MNIYKFFDILYTHQPARRLRMHKQDTQREQIKYAGHWPYLKIKKKSNINSVKIHKGNVI